MRSPILYAAGAALTGAVIWAGTAFAVPGQATGDVNMRTGPGTGYSKITTIPAGAPVEVLDCPSWCQVVFNGNQGWVSSNYIASSGGYDQPYPTPEAVYVPEAPTYSAPVYRTVPRYAYRPAMPARADWRHGRPWWDDRYGAWYNGRDWWYDGGWYNRPRSGVSIEFGF